MTGLIRLKGNCPIAKGLLKPEKKNLVPHGGWQRFTGAIQDRHAGLILMINDTIVSRDPGTVSEPAQLCKCWLLVPSVPEWLAQFLCE